jgi:hypothetical protein
MTTRITNFESSGRRVRGNLGISPQRPHAHTRGTPSRRASTPHRTTRTRKPSAIAGRTGSRNNLKKSQGVRFSTQLIICDVPTDIASRAARRGHWNAAPEHDELWDGYLQAFRDTANVQPDDRWGSRGGRLPSNHSSQYDLKSLHDTFFEAPNHSQSHLSDHHHTTDRVSDWYREEYAAMERTNQGHIIQANADEETWDLNPNNGEVSLSGNRSGSRLRHASDSLGHLSEEMDLAHLHSETSMATEAHVEDAGGGGSRLIASCRECTDMLDWTVDDTCAWLRDTVPNGVRLAKRFRALYVNGEQLCVLDRFTLEDMGFKNRADRKAILVRRDESIVQRAMPTNGAKCSCIRGLNDPMPLATQRGDLVRQPEAQDIEVKTNEDDDITNDVMARLHRLHLDHQEYASQRQPGAKVVGTPSARHKNDRTSRMVRHDAAQAVDNIDAGSSGSMHSSRVSRTGHGGGARVKQAPLPRQPRRRTRSTVNQSNVPVRQNPQSARRPIRGRKAGQGDMTPSRSERYGGGAGGGGREKVPSEADIWQQHALETNAAKAYDVFPSYLNAQDAYNDSTVTGHVIEDFRHRYHAHGG